jgi:hypothetical protein
MNLRLTIEINTKGGNIMTDWIDSLKNEIEQKQLEKTRKEEIQLRKDRIIKSKMPIFWKEINKHIDEQLKEVKERLPEEYHCSKQMIGPDAFKLEIPFPTKRLVVELNMNGNYINTEATYSGGKTSVINIEVDNNDRLMLKSNNGRIYIDAESLSNTIIQNIVGGKVAI